MKKGLVILFLAVLSPFCTLFAHDFSLRCSSGQMLYYTITSSSYPNTVQVTYPGPNHFSPYVGVAKPQGDLIVPSQVVFKGVTYTVTSIGVSAFMGCDSLSSVTIPNSVVEIGESAFDACYELSSVILGSGVSRINNESFFGCRNLTSIVVDASEPPLVYNSTFSGVPLSARILVPAGVMEKYRSSFTWSSFHNFVESGSVESSTFLQAGVSQLAKVEKVLVHDTVLLTKIFHDTVFVNQDCPPSTVVHDTVYQERLIQRIDTVEVVRIVHDTIVSIHRENIYVHDTVVGTIVEFEENVVEKVDPKRDDQSKPLAMEQKVEPLSAQPKNDILPVADDPSKKEMDAVPVAPVEEAPLSNELVDIVNESEVVLNEPVFPSKVDEDPEKVFANMDAAEETLPILDLQESMLIPETSQQSIEPKQYRLSVVSSNEDFGIAQGSGKYFEGEQVEITAQSLPGYHFHVWSDGSDVNPRIVKVSDNRLYIAVFDVDEGPVQLEEPAEIEVYVNGHEVIVKNAQGMLVQIFDSYGRALVKALADRPIAHYSVMAAGTFVVNVGDQSVQRVLIVE